MKTHKKFCFACVILLLACGMAVAGDQEKKKSKEGKSEEKGEERSTTHTKAKAARSR